MSKHIQFWFDIGSPAAFLAWTQIEAIATRYQAELHWKPMLLGGVFKATGNSPPAAVVAKGRYMLADLGRYAQRYGIALQFNPHFPVNTLMVMRGLTGMLQEPAFPATLKLLYEGMWQGGHNLADTEVVRTLLNDAGLEGDEFITLSRDTAVKEKLRQSTEEAVSRGVFGAPSIFVDDELFFGQDRLDFVEQALRNS